MRLVIQRVKEAKVEVGSAIVGQIGRGMLIFLGVGRDDTHQDADDLVNKILQLRIFEDENGKMNLSALAAQAQFLVVSQFTLYGDCDKGRRPSFDQAAEPQKGEELYEYFLRQLRAHHAKVATGRFRAMMDVSLINDGPVTFVLESKGRVEI
jgi:D-tyrosyl-tRNA(Tyr) deacylase